MTRQQLTSLIAGSAKVRVWDTPVNTAIIDRAERRLEHPFPESYRWFLEQYGSGYFGSYELNGVATPAHVEGADEDISEFIGDVVARHEANRSRESWDSRYVELLNIEGDEIYYFDTRHGLVDDEYPVVLIQPAAAPDEFAMRFSGFISRIV